MNLVLVSGQYRILKKKLEAIHSLKVHIQAIQSPKIYFQVETEYSVEETIMKIRKEIAQDKNMQNFDFQIFGFYNGKMDIASYLSTTKKEQLTYYKKDISK